MPTVELQTNNRIWLTYKHFPYKAWNAIGELVDNSSQSYFDNREPLDPVLEREGQRFAVRIDFARDQLLSVVDNAMGMDLEDLERAVQLAAPPPDTSGRGEFGMGMKTSCCWLGDRWSITTKKLGSNTEYSVYIDVDKVAASPDATLEVTEKTVANADEHYTRIEVTDLHRRLHGRTLGRARQYLVEMYRPDIVNGDMELRWDGAELEPPQVEALVTEDGDVEREWRTDIAFDVGGHHVEGWICILAKGARARAGFDLFRRGRVILGRPLGYRPHTIFGEARNDLINQRLYGNLQMDTFPVNHLKDDFLWDGLEDDFQEALSRACQDYVDFARQYRARTGGQQVSPAVVQATNDEIAQELTEEEMLERLTIAETGTVADEVDEAVRDAKAEMLRGQKIEPRIISVGGWTFRIYHPEGMPAAEPYFFRQSATDGEIDIFLNDNHPYVEEVTDESDYLMYARMCVIDGIVEHFLLHHQGEVTPSFPARLKDNLLRGFRY